MSDSPTLLSLAGRVESLTGPCRETDALIALAVGVVPEGAFRPCAAVDVGTFATESHSFWTALAYTASLDAAMMLIPDNVARKDGTAQTPFPRLERYSETEWRANIGFGNSMIGANAKAATPALALTAASLRARSALEASHD